MVRILDLHGNIVVDRLKNKIAIVFGAGGPPGEWSNGKAAAVAYAREGAAVIAIDRLSDAAKETAQIIRDEGGEAGGPLETDDAAFQRSMDINVGSVHRTVRGVLPHFLAQRSGAIVNISSLSAIRWSGYSYFAYCASKAAVNHAAVFLALDEAGFITGVCLPVDGGHSCALPGLV